MLKLLGNIPANACGGANVRMKTPLNEYNCRGLFLFGFLVIFV
jgi:hypothetical protein